MLRTGVADALLDEREEDGSLFPDYGGYCFAHVPETVLALLGADPATIGGSGPARTLPDDVFDGVDTDVEVVVVALIDGYGFEQFRRDYGAYPLLSDLVDRGTVTPLTSVYPSETAAAITTAHTGLLPVQHGLLGWDQYVEEAGTVLQTLPFATRDGEPAGETFDVDARILFEGTSLYESLADGTVATTAVVPEGQLDSAYSRVAMAGLGGAEYDTVSEAGPAISRAVRTAEAPTYVYAYFPQVDAAAHLAGTESDAYRGRLEAVTTMLRESVVDALPAPVAERTLLVLTADHGEVDTPGEDGNVDLREDRFDPLWGALRRDAGGDPIPPVGGPRNVQLHLRDDARADVGRLLEAELDALVMTREEAIDRELFGPGEPGALFRRRLGDLVVIPRDRSVWYDESGLAYVGMHGGLHPDEMLVPFGAARVDRLQG